MAERNQQRRSTFESFLSDLRRVLERLPSKSEKQELEEAFVTIIGFLTDLKTRIELIPSTEDISSVHAAVQKLQESIAKAEQDPVLGSIFGLSRPRAKKREKKAPTEETSVAAKKLLETLETLPVEEIRSKLQDDSYPLTILRTTASILGVASGKNVGRDALIHQIAMRIANSRGYQHLRGDARPQG